MKCFCHFFVFIGLIQSISASVTQQAFGLTPVGPRFHISLGDSQLSAIAAGDTDEEGRKDLVVVDIIHNEVTSLVSRGNNRFDLVPERYVLGPAQDSMPQDLALGFFDADTHLDAWIPGFRTNESTILPGLGDGRFDLSAAVTVPLPGSGNPCSCARHVAVGMFDDDLLTDVAVTNFDPVNHPTAQHVSLFLNPGNTGTWMESSDDFTTSAASGIGIAAGFLNDDSFPDLSVTRLDNNIDIYLNDGTGVFSHISPVVTTVLPETLNVVTGDWNRDGFGDLAINSRNDGVDALPVQLAYGDGTGKFPTLTTLEVDSTAMAVGYLNRDSWPDLVFSNRDEQRVEIFLNDGSGGFQFDVSVPVSGIVTDLIVDNLDRDPLQEIAVVTENGNVDVFSLGRRGATTSRL